MLKGLLQMLLAEGQLADGPDLRVGLEGLLDLGVQGSGLDGDDLRGRVRVMGDRGAAVGAEPAPDGLATAACPFPFLQGAGDG